MAQVSLEETARLLALEQYNVLDTPPEPSFAKIAQLTALVLDAPIAVLGFLDGSRHWFKAAFGTDQRENSRAESFCTQTIEQAGILEVTDALLDSRFSERPVVTDAGVRAYAGVPLTTESGQRIGTLCIFDTRVRSPLEPIERALLLELAGLTMRLLEARISTQETSEPSVTDLQSLEWRALYGRGDDTPPPPAVSAGSSESKLLERVRFVAPAPMIGGAAALPRGRVLVTHTLGTAQGGTVWQVWGLGKTSAPRALRAFTGDMAAFEWPDDAALLLLSLEGLGNVSSAPTRVLASGQIR